MPIGSPDFRFGRIVSAYLIGRNRKREEHPVVLVSPDSEIIQPEDFDPRTDGGIVRANLVAALGISSSYKAFNDPYITLPVGGKTQLAKDSAVILNWYVVLDIPDDCEFLLGDVPSRLMVQIDALCRAELTRRLGSLRGTVAESLGLLKPRS